MAIHFYKTPDRTGILIFHVTCFIPWITENFNKKWSEWKDRNGNIIRPKRGRPPVYQIPDKDQILNRLWSARSYHKKLGHKAKIREIEDKISKLCNPCLV